MIANATTAPRWARKHSRVSLFLAILAVAACSKSKTNETDWPTPSYDLPASQAELEAMLDSAAPELAIAIKGRLRTLAGKGALDLERPAAVGASLSAGLGSTPLASALDAAIRDTHETTALASTMFFRSPYANGQAQIDQALAGKASVIFAVDLLFWYAYTDADLQGRLASLDIGLRNLERVDVPLILGDLPDMRTGEPWMLPPSSVPPPEELARLNERIHSWARPRMNVHVLPLASWSSILATDGEVVVGRGEKPVPARSLMNPDGLHPNTEGVRYMLLRLDPSLELGFPDTSADALEF